MAAELDKPYSVYASAAGVVFTGTVTQREHDRLLVLQHGGPMPTVPSGSVLTIFCTHCGEVCDRIVLHTGTTGNMDLDADDEISLQILY